MKQQQISNWLKGLVFVLGIMGIVFFGGLTYYAFTLKTAHPEDLHWCFIFFSWYTAILCYCVLFQFWKVCKEISLDNSFSLTNAKAFHNMALLGIASGAGYFLRLVFYIVATSFHLLIFALPVFLILLSGIFFILCEALSKLIQNAYEVKLENELTI